ncbi:DUF2947 domain-containing protein [Pseudoalteromonas piscicida]|uniref:DUF2947 domain-containing protein n=1 Tax=Pseudoalteromonas piscicida TaxID=43662 RepID=A0A2A5JWL8_PSEO7|nr:DUF2947 domain-containing protein [Pseudoalteromonas piscicida]PCK33771.1 hypothetical protein CEX98_00390 [Pseudoalteromonas piscicida]
MNYIALDDYKKAWVFKHKDLPIEASDLALIKPMTAARAAVLWSTMVSNEKDHPDFFDKNDWVGKAESWQEALNWEQPWEAGEAFPEVIEQFLDWQDNTTVYFCLSRDDVIETRFDVFKRCWQNFMFLTDGSFLIGKKRSSVVQFMAEGQAKLGTKP